MSQLFGLAWASDYQMASQVGLTGIGIATGYKLLLYRVLLYSPHLKPIIKVFLYTLLIILTPFWYVVFLTLVVHLDVERYFGCSITLQLITLT